MSPFFGLTPEYRLNLFSQIDDIVVNGEGYTWTEVYNFPIWLRRFTYKRIEQRIDERNKALEKQQQQINPSKDPQRPGIAKKPPMQPSYKTKAAKK